MPIKLSWECDSTLVSKVSVYKSTEDFDIKDLPNPLFTSDKLIKEYIDENVETFVKYHYLVSAQIDSDSIYFSPKIEITPEDYSDYLVVHLPFENSLLEDKGTQGMSWSVYHGNANIIEDIDNNGNSVKSAYFNGCILKSNNFPTLGTEDFTIQILMKPFKKSSDHIYLWCRYLAIGTSSAPGYLHIAGNYFQEQGRIHTESRVGWLTDSLDNSYPDNVYKTISIVRQDGIFYQYSDNVLVGSNQNQKTYSILPSEVYIGGNSVRREWINANVQDFKIYKGVALHPNKD